MDAMLTESVDWRNSDEYLRLYQPPKIDGDFKGKHIVTVDQFERRDLQILFDAAASLRIRMKQDDRGLSEVCTGKVLATLFFEASTRTDMSFQAAMQRLGGRVIVASNGVQFSSVYKGENLADTIRAVGCYTDVIALRHPEVGSSYQAAYYLDLLNAQIGNPAIVISGGDGIGEHPTQALLDMFTIVDSKQQIDNLTITMVGDLRHGRTVHSLAKLIARYGPQNVKLCFVSPPSLKMPTAIVDFLKSHRIEVYETGDLSEVLGESDVIYWTRIQEERFADRQEYDAIKDGFIMTQRVLNQAKSDAILMHPLPRKHEMGTPKDHDQLDQDSRSVYFRQMENGMVIRMALLAKVLKGAYV
jgi:aspartate carbamoyltransferase